MTDFSSHIIGASADPELARTIAGSPSGNNGHGCSAVRKFVKHHATPLAVTIGIPAILASAVLFTANDGDNYDADRFGTVSTVSQCLGDEIETPFTCVHAEGDGWRVR